jgi:serine O-acetyltransferase
VIRNLMERIDELENTVNALRSCLDDVATDCALQDDRGGEAQSLKDREILEFLGESSG